MVINIINNHGSTKQILPESGVRAKTKVLVFLKLRGLRSSGVPTMNTDPELERLSEIFRTMSPKELVDLKRRIIAELDQRDQRRKISVDPSAEKAWSDLFTR
jgi:hypothetical protein